MFPSHYMGNEYIILPSHTARTTSARASFSLRFFHLRLATTSLSLKWQMKNSSRCHLSHIQHHKSAPARSPADEKEYVTLPINMWDVCNKWVINIKHFSLAALRNSDATLNGLSRIHLHRDRAHSPNKFQHMQRAWCVCTLLVWHYMIYKHT